VVGCTLDEPVYAREHCRDLIFCVVPIVLFSVIGFSAASMLLMNKPPLPLTGSRTHSISSENFLSILTILEIIGIESQTVWLQVRIRGVCTFRLYSAIIFSRLAA